MTRVEYSGSVPSLISPVILNNSTHIFLLGGYQVFNEQILSNQDLFVLCLSSLTWHQFPISGICYAEPLLPKQQSAGFLYNNSIYLLQGANYSEVLTIWQSIDLLTGQVLSIPSNLASIKYSSVSSGSSLYIFGGQDPNTTNSLIRIDAPSLGLFVLSRDLSTPPARIFSTLAGMAESLYLFGGENQAMNVKYNDLWGISTITEIWTQVDALGDIPSPRSKHSSAFNGYLMFIFGGESDHFLNDLYQYNSYTNYWSAMDTSSSVQPSPRSQSCARYYNNHLYFYGGYDGSSYLSELWVYDLQSSTFTQLPSGLCAWELNTCFFDASLELFYVVSTSSDLNYKKVTYYSLQTQNWCEIAGIDLRAYGSIDLIIEDSLLSLGGGTWDNTPIPSYSIYNFTSHETKTGSISAGVFLPSSLHFAGSIYAFGGASLSPSMIFPGIPGDHLVRIDVSSLYDFYYCGEGSISNGTACVLCPEGTYSPFLDSGECLECPSGTFGKALAANTLLQCLPCDTGSWNNATGRSYCMDCPVNQYCPYGSAYPSELISDAYYTSIQPAAFSADSYLYGYYSDLIVYLAVAVLVICSFLLCYEKIRDTLKIFDIYTSLHNHTPIVPMHIRSTRLGGCCTLMFLLSALIFLLITLVKFNLSNTVEVRSLIPLVTVNNQIQGDISININYYYYGGTCEINGACVDQSTFAFANIYGQISYTCSKSVQTCTVQIHCKSCTLNASAQISINFYEEFSFCSQISVNITSSSSIPGESSSVQSLIGSNYNAYFKGTSPTVFSHSVIPTLFQAGNAEHSGYHVSVDKPPVEGSQYSSSDFGFASGLPLIIGLEITNTVLGIMREADVGMLELFSAIIGTVFGFLSTFGGILKVSERWYERAQEWVGKRESEVERGRRKKWIRRMFGEVKEENREDRSVLRRRRESSSVEYSNLSIVSKIRMKQMSYVTFDASERSLIEMKNEV